MLDAMPLGENARLAADVLDLKPVRGIPTALLHIMDISFLESEAGYPPGAYRQDPDGVYIAFLRKAGVCLVDQYLATNPLTMGECGFEGDAARTATTGAEDVELDGIRIDSPEAVARHLEERVFPALEAAIAAEDEGAPVEALVDDERRMQALLGPDMLKAPYGGHFGALPGMRYGQYGYVHYLTAFVCYPEVMERDFALQADLALKRNARAARAYAVGSLPRVLRLDHDMADSRGTLVDVRMLDRLWFPHFARAIAPYLKAGVRLLWHCDGNLMAMVPRLLEAGVAGFQGFQYEDGMDYPAICRMRTRDGDPLVIWAGASVTRTLPFGTREDVRRELRWLVDNGPPAGLMLAGSSSITPGTNRDNLRELLEGLRYYRGHGR